MVLEEDLKCGSGPSSPSFPPGLGFGAVAPYPAEKRPLDLTVTSPEFPFRTERAFFLVGFFFFRLYLCLCTDIL